ncbi:ergosterol biosynthetic protein 28 isoform X1 [Physcomitrium patens]|uniref:Uncharacterized protein n=1 Tax=Physcomitrium patens TaxID=3218 RepID=A0A7I4F9R1_PHYPA|nr:ergosterol biosynthetic protein 28-like isoform X2 [Physcomitrium patens]|eukprot:XP_024356802.1 ergosterol biosynthetic protein 28-like isoform X2 [Physcomitrella patens]
MCGRFASLSSLSSKPDVHGRTFGVWTLLTCLLCVMTAFNLDNEALYLVTFLSFVFALGYFLIECFIYQTMAVKNVASLFFFAGGSIIWMSIEWNKHHGLGVQYQD